jgi:hypothetical protein
MSLETEPAAQHLPLFCVDRLPLQTGRAFRVRERLVTGWIEGQR